MLEFYLWVNNAFIKKDILVAPTLTETEDETLDSCNVILSATSDPTPIKPDTKAQLRFNGNVISNLVVASDEVSIFSTKPLTYQHSLQLVQNTRLLSKHLVRNSSFSQPRDIRKGHYFQSIETAHTRNVHNNIELIKGEKIIPYVNDGTNKYGFLKIMLKPAYTYNSTSEPQSTETKLSDGWTCSRTSSPSIANTDDIVFIISGTYFDGTDIPTQQPTLKANRCFFNKELKIPFTITNNIKTIDLTIMVKGTSENYYILDTNSSGHYEGRLNVYWNIETYIYSMYDVIDTLRKQIMLKDTRYQKASLFNMPDSTTDLYKILNNTIAPEFVFTSATMYECLAEIFKYYDAIFTLDSNNKLGIEWLNDQTKAKITQKFTQFVGTLKEDDYTTGYVSYFENALVSEEIEVVPTNTNYGYADQVNTGWCFALPHNIHSIEKAEILIPSGRFNATMNWKFEWWDITEHLVNESLYGLLTSFPNDDYLQQNVKIRQNCFYYTGNYIQIGGYDTQWQGGGTPHTETFLRWHIYRIFTGTGVVTSVGSEIIYPEYKSLRMRIKYKAIVAGRVRIESEENKYNGETLVNQGNGAVDLNKLGLNMLGLSYKQGQPVLAGTQELTDWSNRIQKGQIYEYNGGKYVANVVKYTFYNDHIVCSVDFIKNYNALASRIQIDRQKRLSQISNELAVKSEDNYVEYLYYTTDSTVFNNTTKQTLALNNDLMADNTLMAFNYDPLNNFNRDIYKWFYFGVFKINGITPATGEWENFFIPTVKYASGNSVCLEMSYNHQLSAGKRTKIPTDNRWTGTTTDCIYCNYKDEYNGKVDNIDIVFANKTLTEYNDFFPELAPYMFEQVGKIERLEYYKKSNEIFALNYQLTFLPMNSETDFLGNEMLKNHGFIKMQPNDIPLFIYYSTTETYNKFDFFGKGNKTSQYIQVTYSNLTNGFVIFFQTQTGDVIPENVKSWAVCDELGRIYFAHNGIYNNAYSRIYFIPRHERLEIEESIPSYLVHITPRKDGVSSISYSYTDRYGTTRTETAYPGVSKDINILIGSSITYTATADDSEDCLISINSARTYTDTVTPTGEQTMPIIYAKYNKPDFSSVSADRTEITVYFSTSGNKEVRISLDGTLIETKTGTHSVTFSGLTPDTYYIVDAKCLQNGDIQEGDYNSGRRISTLP